MPAHPIFADDMLEIVESFVVETQEIFERLDNHLLALEQAPQDRRLIDEIFRAVHTVKGTSGFLSLEQLAQLSHHFEDVLNRMRRDELQLRPEMMDVLFSAFDMMKRLLQQVLDQQLEPVVLTPLLTDLQAISGGTFTAATSAVRAAREHPAPAPADASAEEAAAKEAIVEEAAAAGPAEPSLVLDPFAAARRFDHNHDTIRVAVDRLDNLLDLVGELVLERNRLLQLVSDMAAEDTDAALRNALTDTSAQVDFLTTELQTAVMRTRMIPIGRVFNKFPRVVRDLAHTFGKQIALVIEGEDTELDKSLIEEISDPLVHLIRNAADHGIERPEVRRNSGKPVQGTIRLAAVQEGNHIVITIEDDGAGMEPERLRRKAVEAGLLTQRETAEMTDDDAFELIFRPGFSTAERVSKISGRGVGMDVVKTHITRLNGTIDITSSPGVGTRFTLRLPLTLAIIQSLLVQVSDETYALPLHTVDEVVRLNGHQVSTVRGQQVLRLRDRVLPLLRLSDVLEIPSRPETAPRYAVIVGIAHYRLGLLVDALIGQKEIVIKPLGAYLRQIPAVAGSTILGDGRVIMILDVGDVIRLAHDRQRGPAAAPLPA